MRWICQASIIVAVLTSPLSAKEAPPKGLIGTVAGSGNEAIAFNHDGSLLLTAQSLGIDVWDTKTLKPAGPPIQLPEGVFTSARFTPTSLVVLAIDVKARQDPQDPSYNTHVGTWDPRSGKPVVGPMILRDRVAAAISDDGSLVGVQYSPGVINGKPDKNYKMEVIDARSGKTTFRFERTSRIDTIKFSPDNKRLLVLEDKRLFETNTSVWDIENNKRIVGPIVRGGGEYGVFASGGESAEFSPDSKRIAIGNDNAFAVYDAVSGKSLFVVDPVDGTGRHEDGVYVQFSRDSKQIRTNYRGSRLFDAETGKLRSVVQLPEGYSLYHEFSADSKRMGGWYGRRTEKDGIVETGVAVWDVEAKTFLAKWPIPMQKDGIQTAAISPDGHYIAASNSVTDQTYLYDVEGAIAK